MVDHRGVKSGGVRRAAATSTAATRAASDLLPQCRGADLGRAEGDARLAAAGGQCGAVDGVFPGRIDPSGKKLRA